MRKINKINNEGKVAILNLCAEKWIENCGISVGIRTLYWDIGFKLCKEDYEEFKRYILSKEFGEESLQYDIMPYTDLEFYQEMKDTELQTLPNSKKGLLLKGFEFLYQNTKNNTFSSAPATSNFYK
jgi:hypothetical protein